MNVGNTSAFPSTKASIEKKKKSIQKIRRGRDQRRKAEQKDMEDRGEESRTRRTDGNCLSLLLSFPILSYSFIARKNRRHRGGNRAERERAMLLHRGKNVTAVSRTREKKRLRRNRKELHSLLSVHS